MGEVARPQPCGKPMAVARGYHSDRWPPIVAITLVKSGRERWPRAATTILENRSMATGRSLPNMMAESGRLASGYLIRAQTPLAIAFDVWNSGHDLVAMALKPKVMAVRYGYGF